MTGRGESALRKLTAFCIECIRGRHTRMDVDA